MNNSLAFCFKRDYHFLCCAPRRSRLGLFPETTRAADPHAGRDSVGAPVGCLNHPTTHNAIEERLS